MPEVVLGPTGPFGAVLWKSIGNSERPSLDREGGRARAVSALLFRFAFFGEVRRSFFALSRADAA